MPKFSDSPYFLLKDYFDILSKPPSAELEEHNIDPYPLWESVKFCDWETTSTSAYYEYKSFTKKKSNLNVDGVEWENWTSLVKWNAWYEPFVKFLDNSILGIPNKIIVQGGNFIDLYIKGKTDFKSIRLKPIFVNPKDEVYFQFIDKEKQKIIPGPWIDSISFYLFYLIDYDYNFLIDYDYNFLVMTLGGFRFDIYDTKKEIKTILNDHIGQEVYFRKDSYFHYWLKNSSYSYYLDKWETDVISRNYVNTDKDFIYFGLLYTTKNESNIPICYIKFDGIKTFINNSIPSHQRTPNLTKFLDIYFDRVYSEVYSLQKDIFSLYDPMETNQKYLSYISDQYYIDVGIDIENFNVSKQRSFIKNLPLLLKKKSTYSSIKILWKVLSNTLNWMDIYDRWHDSSITGQVSASDYVDISYLNKYTDEIDTTGLTLSTSYMVELNLDYEPLEIDSIVTKDFCDILYNSLELFRPVNRVGLYSFSISPVVDPSKQWSILYPKHENREHLLSSFESSVESFSDDGWVHIQNDSSTTWIVEHELNSTQLLVRVVNFKHDEEIPKSIEILDTKKIKLEFDKNIRGVVLLKKVNKSILNTSQTETWIVNHTLNSKEVLIQFKENKKWYYPDQVTLIDVYNLEVKESENVEDNGTAMVCTPDYTVQLQPTPQQTWTVTHNLNRNGVIAQFYDSDSKLIVPKYYKLINSNNIIAEFDEPVMGYAVVEKVGNYILLDDTITPGNLYVKIGTVEGSILSDGIIFEEVLYDIEQINNSYYLTFTMPFNIEGDIREIGIFESSSNLLIIYSKCYPLYKHKNIEIKFNYQMKME
jgi:hypothetical protein